ncbi:MAG: GMC family oxidoreductase N-terminal domain-containing protein [Acidimicrobiia bacterium]|nr:GMC family oxidoreductase N-terminal domain-containing protein [Acidimicrobiia bacterium]
MNVDYVIVGGGSAGSVLAGRLTAAGAEVLLLEAGGTDRRPDVLVPAGVLNVYKHCNWKYVPEPDPSRGGVQEAWAAGRILGGGGSINATVFVRGNPDDFDGWAKAGAEGWDHDSVLPYFKRMETWAGGADEFRGGGGPIDVGFQTMDHPANHAFLEAATQAGHQRVHDYNGERQHGVGHVQVNQKRGLRSQASRRYLRSVADRSRLKVCTNVFAHRVLFEGTRAVGVEYERKGQLLVARCRREVIVAAGSLSSPRLLQTSGVGPRAELEALGLHVVHDSPGVGANLQEHITVMQRWHATVPTINTIGPVGAVKAVAEYARRGTGALAATVFHVQAMHKTDPGLAAPDVQIAFASFATVRETDADGILKVQPAKEDGFLVAAMYLHPRIRGRVGLRSSDPAARPVIEHSLIGDPDDLAGVLAGMAEGRRIMEQPAMTGMVGARFEPEAQCRTDADWEDFTRATVTYGAHPVGTCRMGLDDDSVVGPDLRVHGVTGLRVVDASVMPTVTTGNTNAPTMMLAEKGADLVLADR